MNKLEYIKLISDEDITYHIDNITIRRLFGLPPYTVKYLYSNGPLSAYCIDTTYEKNAEMFVYNEEDFINELRIRTRKAKLEQLKNIPNE